jgi:hypothetical protein
VIAIRCSWQLPDLGQFSIHLLTRYQWKNLWVHPIELSHERLRFLLLLFLFFFFWLVLLLPICCIGGKIRWPRSGSLLARTHLLYSRENMMTKEWHKRHFGKLPICRFNPSLYNSNSRDKTDNSKRSSDTNKYL